MGEQGTKILSHAKEVFAEVLERSDKGGWLQVLLCQGLGSLGKPPAPPVHWRLGHPSRVCWCLMVTVPRGLHPGWCLCKSSRAEKQEGLGGVHLLQI